jgi:ferric-dicitrate binding protein FerR (iron transport regulator)
MKTSGNRHKNAEALNRYLSGEMSPEESSAFKAAISAVPDTRKAWNKLHSRLQDEKLVPARGLNSGTSFIRPLLKIAAVVLILAGLGAVAYLKMSHKPAAEMVQLNTGNEANTLVKTLADGSVIYIAQNSLFSFPQEFTSGPRQVGLKGEAFFDVVPSPGKPFIIATEEVLIEVLGTAFNVKTQNNGEGFRLSVDRGKVKVTLKADPSGGETVLAGEQISVVKNSLVKSKLIAGESSSWYKQRMHFKDEPLGNIILVLNRNFNTTFVLADSETGKHRLTVTFDNETAETITGLFCTALNLKSQTINGEIVLSENKEGAKQR